MSVRCEDKGSRFILKTGGPRYGWVYVLCDEVHAYHPPETRVGQRIDMGALGKVGFSKATGAVHKDRLWLNSVGYGAQASCDYSGAGVKTVLRAVRPQELEELEAARAELAEAHARVKAAKERMAAAAQGAFTSGHYVPVGTLVVVNAGKPAARRKR